VSGEQPSGDPDPRRFLGDVLGFGWVLPAAIAAGAGLGYVGDRVAGIFPILTIALGLVGLAAGLRQVYRESGVISGEGKKPGA
jgi:F0F1-type ATP synthase assembly protein I